MREGVEGKIIRRKKQQRRVYVARRAVFHTQQATPSGARRLKEQPGGPLTAPLNSPRRQQTP